MTKMEQLMRRESSEILLNACVGLERYKKAFGFIPNTVLDMGAHIGGLTLQAMEQGVPYIMAVEADKHNYMNLTENIRRQTERIRYEGNVDCLNRAFCDTNNATVELIAPYGGNFGTVQRSMFYSKSARNVKKSYMVKHTETINIDGILEMLSSRGVNTIDLFKCDIEGAEFIAMPMNDKTKAFFSHIRYIDLELHPWTNSDYYDQGKFYETHKEFKKGKSTVVQYFEFLRDCGFCIPDDMLRMVKHEYLKLTTYNTLLCKEFANAVCV